MIFFHILQIYRKSSAEAKFILTVPRPNVYMNFSSNIRKVGSRSKVYLDSAGRATHRNNGGSFEKRNRRLCFSDAVNVAPWS